MPATTQDSIYVSSGTYQLITTLPSSKTPIYTSGSFDLVNNADWLITTLPSGNALSQIIPNKLRVLVAQGGNTQNPTLELADTQWRRNEKAARQGEPAAPLFYGIARL